MELNEAIKYITKQIKVLEEVVYTFETVTLPRVEQDKKILETMRTHQLKMLALKERADKGEEVPQDEVFDAVPEVFR